jgi:predicted nucleic acid-binding Zn ribbon protein
MDQLGTLLRQAVNLLPQRQELKESLALALWEQAVGEALAKNTKPLRLYRSTLIVIVPSQAWRKSCTSYELRSSPK